MTVLCKNVWSLKRRTGSGGGGGPLCFRAYQPILVLFSPERNSWVSVIVNSSDPAGRRLPALPSPNKRCASSREASRSVSDGVIHARSPCSARQRLPRIAAERFASDRTLQVAVHRPGSQCRMFNLSWHCFTKLSHQGAIKIVFPLLISSRKECGWNPEPCFTQSPPKQRMEVFHGGQGGLNEVAQPSHVQPFTAPSVAFKTSIVNELRVSGGCLKAA